MPIGVKVTKEQEAIFLEEYAKSLNVTQASKVVGVARKVWYVRRKKSKRFAAKWEEAHKLGVRKMEEEARRRAVDGIAIPIGVDKDGNVVYKHKYSDSLLMFLLKGERSGKYGQRPANLQHSQHHTIEHKHTVKFEMEDLTTDELAAVTKVLGHYLRARTPKALPAGTEGTGEKDESGEDTTSIH